MYPQKSGEILKGEAKMSVLSFTEAKEREDFLGDFSKKEKPTVNTTHFGPVIKGRGIPLFNSFSPLNYTNPIKNSYCVNAVFNIDMA